MNRKQIIILWVGIAIFVLMGLFPPWVVYEQGHLYFLHKLTLFSPIRTNNGSRIDVPRLCVQWAMVAVVTSGLLITLKDKKKD